MGGKYEEKILVSNAEALHSQLLLVDPAFYHCMNYKSLSTLSEIEKSSFVDFIHPESLKQPMFNNMLNEIHMSTRQIENNTDSIFSANDYHVYQLTKRLNLIDALCTAKIVSLKLSDVNGGDVKDDMKV